jgi:hypothetical protein
MSKGFVNVTHSSNGGLSYYLREGECVAFKHPKGYDREEILQHWQEIEKNEKLGNKVLGIRGRHDARVRTNYVLSMPNSLSPNECIERVQSIIDKTPIKNCVYTTVVHKGEKDGITNQHVHLLVNERIITTQKKDREMIRKEWLEKSFKALYEKEFKQEFEAGKSVAPRERINQGLFEADRKVSRQGILRHQKEYETVADLKPNHSLGNALLMQSLKSFEQFFVADQEQSRLAAERRAEAERQAAEQQAQAQKQEQERILQQKIVSLSPSFVKERAAQDVQTEKEQALEKARIAKEKEEQQLEERKQEVKKEQVREAPRIRRGM